jgi:hypothetical protein
MQGGAIQPSLFCPKTKTPAAGFIRPRALDRTILNPP